VAPVFAPVVAAWRAAAARYTDELRLILGFQNQLEQIMRDRLIELRGARGPGECHVKPPMAGRMPHSPGDSTHWCSRALSMGTVTM
jgi:hypothetical protein